MDNDEHKIPEKINIIEEQVIVEKKIIEKAKVYIRKVVHEEKEVVTIPVACEETDIQKVAVNKIVEAIPAIRYEENKIIIPVVKEVLITEKKLMLVEEIHVSKRIVQKEEKQIVTLRKEEAVIERTPSDSK